MATYLAMGCGHWWCILRLLCNDKVRIAIPLFPILIGHSVGYSWSALTMSLAMCFEFSSAPSRVK
jgi:hypothetical protein